VVFARAYSHALQELQLLSCVKWTCQNRLCSPSVSSWWRDESQLLEVLHEPEQHLLGIDDLVEPEPSCLGRVRHHVIFEVENSFSEGPSRGVTEGVIQKVIRLDHASPEWILVRHKLGQ